MDTTHLHLLLNHVPTIGFIIAIGLFITALVARSDDLKRASLALFVGIALATIATYTTGNAAQAKICVSAEGQPCEDPTVSKALIEAHESAAFFALVFIQLTGAVAWLGLWAFRRRRSLSPLTAGAVLVLSLLGLAAVARAANVGGEIRHPEIMAADVVIDDYDPAVRPVARQVGNFVRDTPWAWIAAETIHFIGLTLLTGIVLLVNLRMLGVLSQLSFAALDRLLPWAMLGLGLNVATGMLFYMASPGQYLDNPAFFWKIGLLLLAGANTLYFTFDSAWQLRPGDRAPLLSQLVATSAVVLWIGVMYFGTMLPFIGGAF